MITESSAHPQGGVRTLRDGGFLVIKTLPFKEGDEALPGASGAGAGPGGPSAAMTPLPCAEAHDNAASGDSCPCFLSRASYLP